MNFSAPFFLNLTLRSMKDSVSTNSTDFSSATVAENLRFYSAVSLDSVFLPTLLRDYASNSFSATSTGSQRTLQRSDAYFFAIAACVCQLIKSQSDLQHLYFSRRASVRVKGELVASVYEKALKRKDVTGAVQKDQGKDPKGKGKEDKEGAPQDSSSADVGKIVSLIAADSDRVSRFVSLGPVSFSVFLIPECVFSNALWSVHLRRPN
jgi:ABC-type multidrug transport system fused ATPase/permease subunit